LQALTVFYETRTLEKAAVQLGITQPAVSIQLKHLEKMVSHPLFHSQGRNKVLTKYGESLAKKLQIDLRAIENSIFEADREFSEEENVHLKIGGRNEFLQRLISPEMFKGSLEFIEMSSSQVVKSLEDGMVDLAITHIRAEHVDYICKKLRSDEIFLITPNSWKIKSNPNDFFQQAHLFPTVTYSKELKILDGIKSFYRLEKDWKIKATMTDWNVIRRWVEEGLAWAAVPGIFAQAKGSFQKISLQEVPHSIDYYFYIRRDLRKLPWCRKFIDRVTEAASKETN